MNDKTPSRDEPAESSVLEAPGATSSDPTSSPPADQDNDNAARTATDPKNQPAAGRGLAWFALLLALPGTAFVVFWLVQQPDRFGESTDMAETVSQRVETALAVPLERLDNQAAVVVDLERQLQSTDDRLNALSDGLDSLKSSLEETEARIADWQPERMVMRDDFDQLVESLEARMVALNEQAGEQREFDRELARRLQLMEAAALLQMGQHRYDLADDVPAARQAFRAADAVIQGLDEPRLAGVRRQLLAELEALDGYRQPDWMALSARLGRIAHQVNDWPLRPALAEAAGMEPSAEAPEEGGRMDELRRSLRQLVQVRPRDGLPVDESRVQWVREQARLRLTTMEWGLARHDWSIVEGQKAQLVSLVNEWFEPDSPAVVDFHAAMNELQQQSRSEEPPNLGAALSALREQMDRS